ncbi:MAG: uracil-DNA glycosylase [Candidatus Latescibacteria bacterium]|jgi:uracil-DNA glycosylase|nr:uracil-DNA glycosylase [Candidatus Latescibacterota bacterium]
MNNQQQLAQLMRDAATALSQQRELGVDVAFMPEGLDASLKLPVENTELIDTVAESLTQLFDRKQNCTDCALGNIRKNFVFGSGNENADLMLIGEAPGADEDTQGLPFVGAAGQLLTKILEAVQFSRDDVYIANILKCRPPNNRDPEPIEIDTCGPILREQIRLIQPKIICALGRIAAQSLLQTNASLGRLRGTLHDFEGTRLMVTYHPSALLRNPSFKRPTWEDVQMLRQEYDRLTGKDQAASGQLDRVNVMPSA